MLELVGALLEAVIALTVEWASSDQRKALDLQRLEHLDDSLLEPQNIQMLLQAGNAHQAVQLYRKETEATVHEANVAIEGLQDLLYLNQHLSQIQAIKERATDLPQILHLLKSKNRLNAIKAYRKQTNTGLREAKEAIDVLMIEQNVWQQQERLMRWVERTGSSYTGERAIDFTTYFADRELELSLTAQNREQIIRLCNMGRKIEAIKLYRALTGTGLKEAKSAVEALEREHTPLAIALGERDELQRLLQAGKKIEAIKYYRQTTGVGLKEAKAAVENLVADQNVGIAPSPGLPRLIDPDELRHLLQTKGKIAAIKYYRQITGVGLKEAKESVEWVEAQMYHG